MVSFTRRFLSSHETEDHEDEDRGIELEAFPLSHEREVDQVGSNDNIGNDGSNEDNRGHRDDGDHGSHGSHGIYAETFITIFVIKQEWSALSLESDPPSQSYCFEPVCADALGVQSTGF